MNNDIIRAMVQAKKDGTLHQTAAKLGPILDKEIANSPQKLVFNTSGVIKEQADSVKADMSEFNQLFSEWYAPNFAK